MRKSLLLSAVALVATPLVAQAADMAAKTAPMPVVATQYPWTGFHVGLGGGGQYMSAKSAVAGSEQGTTDAGGTSYQSYGQSGESHDNLGKFSGLGAVDVGYDYQLSSSFVAGVFAGFDFGKSRATHGSDTLSGYNDLYSGGTPNTLAGTGGYSGSLSTSAEVGNSWNVGARLGFLPFERTLVYALAGYSSAKVKTAVRTDTSYEGLGGNSDFSSWITDGTSKWKGGLLIGGGVETALTDHFTLKLEYRHADYGKTSTSYSFNESGPGYTYAGGVSQSKKITTDSVRAVVSYRF